MLVENETVSCNKNETLNHLAIRVLYINCLSGGIQVQIKRVTGVIRGYFSIFLLTDIMLWAQVRITEAILTGTPVILSLPPHPPPSQPQLGGDILFLPCLSIRSSAITLCFRSISWESSTAEPSYFTWWLASMTIWSLLNLGSVGQRSRSQCSFM